MNSLVKNGRWPLLFLLKLDPAADLPVIFHLFYLFAFLFPEGIWLFYDFPRASGKFHDFPGLEIEIINSLTFQVRHDQ